MFLSEAVMSQMLCLRTLVFVVQPERWGDRYRQSATESNVVEMIEGRCGRVMAECVASYCDNFARSQSHSVSEPFNSATSDRKQPFGRRVELPGFHLLVSAGASSWPIGAAAGHPSAFNHVMHIWTQIISSRRKPACSKSRSLVKASWIPRSSIMRKLAQSTRPQCLS